MKFRAVTNNKRQLDLNWEVINAYLSKWRPGTPIDIEIKRRVRRKSNPQRRMYFAHILRTYAQYLGYDVHEEQLLHRQLKIVYHQVKPDKKGIYRNIPHVFSEESELNVKQRSDFISWVVRKAAQDGCYIPDVGE
jgi:CRISPR/Cas system-associated exonuclease Cas4 (RecB family)